MSFLLELNELLGTHYCLRVHRDVVDAVSLELLCIMRVCHKQKLQGSPWRYIGLEVPRADVNKAGQDKVVGEDEKLDEEHDRMLLDLEVVRVDVLNDRVEVELRDAFYFYALKLVRLELLLFEFVGRGKHRGEVGAASLEDQAVALYQGILN